MKTKTLGTTDVVISAMGLGAMPLSLNERPPEQEAIAVIHRALDLGVTLVDTADSYCLNEEDKHHNEKLIAKALSLYSKDTSKIMVATKGGLIRPGGDWKVNGDPQHLRKTIRESHEALGAENAIPLWQLHATDPRFPIEASLQPVREAVDEGLIRLVGLSNVTVDEIERARKLLPIVSIQNQFNPWCRRPEKDAALEYCEKEQLTFFPWSPLGGSYRVKQLNQFRKVTELAHLKNVSPQQVILAWLISKSPCVVPIPGARRFASIEDSAKALDLRLTSDEVEQIDLEVGN